MFVESLSVLVSRFSRYRSLFPAILQNITYELYPQVAALIFPAPEPVEGRGGTLGVGVMIPARRF